MKGDFIMTDKTFWAFLAGINFAMLLFVLWNVPDMLNAGTISWQIALIGLIGTIASELYCWYEYYKA